MAGFATLVSFLWGKGQAICQCKRCIALAKKSDLEHEQRELVMIEPRRSKVKRERRIREREKEREECTRTKTRANCVGFWCGMDRCLVIKKEKGTRCRS